VESSLFESQIAWLLFRAVGYFATGKPPAGKLGSASAHLVPYQVYPSADGELMIAAPNERLFKKLMQALGLSELADHPDFNTNERRVVNREALNAKIVKRLATAGVNYWIEHIGKAGVPCSRINTIEDVLKDPQVAARDMIMELDHASLGKIKVPGIPIKMSDTPGTGRRPPPLLGQHQKEVLEELDLSKSTLEKLSKKFIKNTQGRLD